MSCSSQLEAGTRDESGRKAKERVASSSAGFALQWSTRDEDALPVGTL